MQNALSETRVIPLFFETLPWRPGFLLTGGRFLSMLANRGIFKFCLITDLPENLLSDKGL
jgi:hypothetical protein